MAKKGISNTSRTLDRIAEALGLDRKDLLI